MSGLDPLTGVWIMAVVVLRDVPNVSGVYDMPAYPTVVRRPFVESPGAEAGFPSPAGDYIENELDLNEYLVRNRPATFFIRFKGDSLTDLGILDGDIGTVDRSLPARDGQVVVAALDGGIVAKVYATVEGRPALVSRNERVRYPVLYLDRFDDCVLWGCVTSVARRL